PVQLIKDGENGLLVPIDEPEAMAMAIKRVLDDNELSKTLGSKGRASYEAGFTEESVIKRYLDFFQQVAG
ncbi:MAG: glycosyltransferase, partial [Rhodospirillaceae bacterium]|nr:glycosyltransferase [Rhodospirillaceae bacterium]